MQDLHDIKIKLSMAEIRDIHYELWCIFRPMKWQHFINKYPNLPVLITDLYLCLIAVPAHENMVLPYTQTQAANIVSCIKKLTNDMQLIGQNAPLLTALKAKLEARIITSPKISIQQ